jgi:hypothetical protein
MTQAMPARLDGPSADVFTFNFLPLTNSTTFIPSVRFPEFHLTDRLYLIVGVREVKGISALAIA